MNSNVNKLEKVALTILNIVKIITLILIAGIFFYQQTSSEDAQSVSWIKTAIFVLAGFGFSSVIASSIIKQNEPKKIFIIIISVLGLIFLFLVLNLENIIFKQSIDPQTKTSFYIVLGVSFVVLLISFLLKIFISKKQTTTSILEENDDKMMYNDDYEDKNKE